MVDLKAAQKSKLCYLLHISRRYFTKSTFLIADSDYWYSGNQHSGDWIQGNSIRDIHIQGISIRAICIGQLDSGDWADTNHRHSYKNILVRGGGGRGLFKKKTKKF